MKINLHSFGAIYEKNKISPDWDKEETDSKKRRYHFGIDLDQNLIDETGNEIPDTSFRKTVTLDKLEKMQVNKTHKEMQYKDDIQIWDYCPQCIAKIKTELGL